MRLSKARKEFVTAVMKDAIFEAAGAVLAQYGARGMTMDRVATTAGLATGSLYNYFQDKDDLLKCVFGRIVEPLFLAIDQVVRADSLAPWKLEGVVLAARDHGIKHKGLLRVLVSSDYESETRRAVRSRLLTMVTSVIEQGIVERSFRPHNPTQTGRVFLGVLSELLELQASDASNDDVNEYVEVLLEAIRNGFPLHGENDRESECTASASLGGKE